MAALSSSVAMVKNQETHFLSGSSLKPMDKCFLKISFLKISSGKHCSGSFVGAKATRKLPLVVRAGGGSGRPSSGSVFVSGFVLGGLIVGALGCVYAPQISRVIAGADSKNLMRKLPKFMYDEEKALEKTRKVLSEKIAQLNSAIDGVSSQLRADEDDTNGYAASTEEVEASAQ